MTQSQFEARATISGTEKVLDGNNLFVLESHDLIVHTVLPHYIPSWMNGDTHDYAATDGEWKYYMGFAKSSALGAGWYNFPGQGIVEEYNHPFVFADAGGYCNDGCLFHLKTDPNEYYDVSADYPEITSYYEDLINAIYSGGFDEEYHS